MPIITTAGRLYIRFYQFRRFQADDIFNILALITLCGSSVTDEIILYLHSEVLLLRWGLAGNLFFWTTLYLVKASFLALIWSVFNASAWFRRFWWFTTIYTFLTYWPIVLSELWQCGTPSTYDDPRFCDYDRAVQDHTKTLILRFALHISSDILIVVCPLSMIRKLHMSLSRKIAAAAVFALIIIDISVGIARNVSVTLVAQGKPTDASGYVEVIGSVVEPAIAVLMCSLPPYRVLVFKLRSRQTGESRELQHNAAHMDRKGWWSRRLAIFTDRPFPLTVSIPDPSLEITLLRERSHYSTGQGSEGSWVERPEMVHVTE